MFFKDVRIPYVRLTVWAAAQKIRKREQMKKHETIIKFQDRSPSGVKQSIWRGAQMTKNWLKQVLDRNWTKKGNGKVKQIVKKPV